MLHHHSVVVKVTTFQVLKQLSFYLAEVLRQLQKGSLEFTYLLIDLTCLEMALARRANHAVQ